MSNQLTPSALMAKADRAYLSARNLLGDSDADGATNRAYYAMFDAARAALIASGVLDTRTHDGVIGMFGLHLVKNGPLPEWMGEVLNRTYEIRLMADYKDDSVKPAVAEETVKKAETFIATIKALQLDKQPEPPRLDSSSDSSFEPS